MTMAFQHQGDAILLAGVCKDELGGSEYLFVEHGLEEGRPPQLDLAQELNVQRLTLAAIRKGLVKSAHDCSDGGLAVALAECCLAGNLGAHVDLPETVEASPNTRLDAVLFGETQSRVVLSAAPESLPLLQEMARRAGVTLSYLGSVGGDKLTIGDNRAGVLKPVLNIPVHELNWAYRGAIARLMNQ